MCSWANRVFSQENGRDFVHAGLVKLLRNPSVLSKSKAMVIVTWKWRVIDAVRQELGDTRRLGISSVRKTYSMESVRRQGSCTLNTTSFELRELCEQSIMPQRTQDMLLDWAQGWNLQDIAQKYNVSPGRITQIFKKAVPGYRDFHHSSWRKGSNCKAPRRVGTA